MTFTAFNIPPQLIFSRDSTPLTDQQRIDAIVSDFELGCTDAITTLKRLQDHGFLATPKQLATVFCAGIKALSQDDRRAA